MEEHLVPSIEIGECTLCQGCTEAYPEVFHETEQGYVEILYQKEYPVEQIDEAIKYCPADCISWEKT